MKYFSTFTGIGGFERGIEEAYDNILNRYKASKNKQEFSEDLQGGVLHTDEQLLQRTPTCVGYSEIDKYACQIYQKHYPEHKNYGDITRIDAATLPDFDLFVGGFPCQAFSIAGKRRGFDDTRGTLFFDVARILKEKRPRNFILENVKGLLSHDNGNTFKTIIATLIELGYCVEWQVLNSKNFGVPQNRERVFIIGHLGGIPERKVFPLGRSDSETVGENDRQIVSGTLTTRNAGPECQFDGSTTVIGTLRTHKDGQGFREVKSGLAPTIPARAREDGSGQPIVAVPLKFLDRNQKNYQGEYSFTVDTVNSGGVMKEIRIRRLTPVECERLQGFPDGWTEGVSDTQRYKTLGNAVTVNVIKGIIKRLYLQE